MEEKMMKDLNVPFKAVLSGKFRRYFSLWNVVDLVKVPIGILQSLFTLSRFNPKVVFAKGGFVSFPVAVAAWILRVPVILHESDVVPGLANKICAKFAKKVCVSFEKSREHFPGKDVVFTGNPVRKELIEGDKERGRKFTGLHNKKPVLLVMGGSQGAKFLNNIVHDHLDALLEKYHVIHLAGEGEGNDGIPEREGYKRYAYVDKEMKDLYALADVIVTRSGANTLAELAAVGKPALLVPLGKEASRGDQIDNAHEHAKNHPAHVMEEHQFSPSVFFEKLEELVLKASTKIDADQLTAVNDIIDLLEDL